MKGQTWDPYMCKRKTDVVDIEKGAYAPFSRLFPWSIITEDGPDLEKLIRESGLQVSTSFPFPERAHNHLHFFGCEIKEKREDEPLSCGCIVLAMILS